jgi:hypothetical protein
VQLSPLFLLLAVVCNAVARVVAALEVVMKPVWNRRAADAPSVVPCSFSAVQWRWRRKRLLRFCQAAPRGGLHV